MPLTLFTPRNTSAYKRQFHVRKGSKESKEVVKEPDKKGRQKGHPKLPDVKIQTVMVALEEFDLQKKVANRTATISSQQCLEPQEQIFLGLDKYIRAVFSQSRESWGNDMLRFVSPTGDNTTLTAWERIADQCTTIEDLIKKSLVAKAGYMMDDMIESLPTNSQIRDPSLLLQLWQACLKLLSIDRREVLQYSTLTKLLDAIKTNLIAAPREDCALLSVVDGLTTVSRNEMKETLRLAIFKTTATLKDVIGDENIMVLGLWSLYCRTWKTSQQSQHALLDKLEHVWETTKAAPLADTVRISYYYTYAVLNISKNEAKAAGLARDLVGKLCDLPFEPIWSMQTLAFQVCSKLWARHLRSCAFAEAGPHDKVNKRREYYEVMERAICALEKGDLICQVAASSMATTLGNWLEKSILPQKKMVDWHDHANDLLHYLSWGGRIN